MSPISHLFFANVKLFLISQFDHELKKILNIKNLLGSNPLVGLCYICISFASYVKYLL